VPPDVRAAAYETVATHAAEGRIVLDIEAMPLAEIGDAWSREAGGGLDTKLVVVA